LKLVYFLWFVFEEVIIIGDVYGWFGRVVGCDRILLGSVRDVVFYMLV